MAGLISAQEYYEIEPTVGKEPQVWLENELPAKSAAGIRIRETIKDSTVLTAQEQGTKNYRQKVRLSALIVDLFVGIVTMPNITEICAGPILFPNDTGKSQGA